MKRVEEMKRIICFTSGVDEPVRWYQAPEGEHAQE